VKTEMKTKLWTALLALGALAAFGARADAAGVGNPSYLNIDVTITSSLSVAVDNVNSSTQNVSWTGTSNQAIEAPVVSTVTNDTGVLSEVWKLSANTHSLDTTGGGQEWTLATTTTSVGPDQFALQAVFGSSHTTTCSGLGEWVNSTIAPPLSAATPVQYTSTVLAATSLTTNGSYTPDVAAGTMYANSSRALCWRAIMPQSTSTQNKQNIQLIVTAF
jgi:hypothetical protein